MRKKISNFLKRFIYGFSYGLKSAENEMFMAKSSSNVDSSYVQQIKDVNVGKDLMKGEVSQEVKDLRYSTYTIYKESKNYEYQGDGIAIKKEVIPFNINNFTVVQKNKEFCKGIGESLDENIDSNYDQFTLTFAYENSPRFRVERFVDTITVSCINGVVNLILRFNKAYDLSNPMTRMFYNELMKLETNERRNEIYSDNIVNVCFTTYKAQGDDDFVMYAFNKLHPKKYEFFDEYVNLYFSIDNFNREDLTAKFFSKNQQEKYNQKSNREKKMTISVANPKYVCSECGSEMNQFDFEITSHDFGRAYCIKCLEKYLTLDK